MALREHTKPVLWHIGISHYSEKARWALDYKGVEHERRISLPGVHVAVSLWLTRGSSYTFPVLELDGKRFGDSTALIAALEDRFPEPPLYPADPAERRRALELEDFFDEELGPYIRRFVFHQVTQDRELFEEITAREAPPPLNRFRRIGSAYAKAVIALRFRTRSEGRAELAQAKVEAAIARLERELGGGEYLVGGRFSVADLTAASLFYPLALPPEGPMPPELLPDSMHEFRDRHRGAREWIEEMFRRHRHRDRARAGEAGADAEPAAVSAAS